MSVEPYRRCKIVNTDRDLNLPTYLFQRGRLEPCKSTHSHTMQLSNASGVSKEKWEVYADPADTGVRFVCGLWVCGVSTSPQAGAPRSPQAGAPRSPQATPRSPQATARGRHKDIANT